jgi:hypothetical protein
VARRVSEWTDHHIKTKVLNPALCLPKRPLQLFRYLCQYALSPIGLSRGLGTGVGDGHK